VTISTLAAMSDQPTKVPRGRSPSYPGIPLGEAVERARQAYAVLRTHSAPIKAFTDAWGYKSQITGPATSTVAALRKYGLLDQQGNGDSRTAKLSDLAVEIIMKEDPADAIRRAALHPPIFGEMWSMYATDVPPETALRYEFVTNRGFTETGFLDFLRSYKETVSYANLGASVKIEPPPQDERADEDDEEDDDGSATRRNARRRGGNVLTYPVPVGIGVDVVVEGKFPLTPTQWTQFIAVLTAMKPALVADEDHAERAQESHSD
jgi:hypothetical protein